ncbi:hypothetical protein [Pseudomonas chlororaphis]|uniref:hypothetical protein n=1 Tax=Pseudomonas chlororaphis TaxID=587753 RepID=UPI001CC1ECAA|nr:hypothetical protein [Pseudomonas chlororaphis]
MYQLELAVGRAVRVKVGAAFAVLVLGGYFVADLELLFGVQHAAVPGFSVGTVVGQAFLEVADDGLSIRLFSRQVNGEFPQQNAHATTSFSKWAFNSPV